MDSACIRPQLLPLHAPSDPETASGAARNPTRLASLVRPEAVEKHRSLVCEEYDSCLDTALAHGWTSFTCERCALFARPKVSQTIWATDHTLFSVSR